MCYNLYTENNSNPWVFIAVAIIFGSVFAYVIITKIKRKNTSWAGTVIDKSVTESVSSNNNANGNDGPGITFGANNAVNRHYVIKIKSDNGKEFNWPVGEGFYNSISVGDRLAKNPGTETPTKINQPSQEQ